MLSHQDGLVDAAVIVDYVVEFIQFFKHSCVCVCVLCVMGLIVVMKCIKIQISMENKRDNFEFTQTNAQRSKSDFC